MKLGIQKPRASQWVKQLRIKSNHYFSTYARQLLGSHSYRWTGLPRGIVSGTEYVQAGMLCIPNGMTTLSGGIMTSTGDLIHTHCFAEDGKSGEHHPLFHFRFNRVCPPITQHCGRVASLTAGWQGAFYHWMLQILPRLSMIEPPYPKLYVDQRHQFQRESFALLGMGHLIIDAAKYPTLMAEQLEVPEVHSHPPEHHYSFLRDLFRPFLRLQPAKRLYISRQDARTRRLKNEAEVWPVLERYGFEKVVLSTLSLQEQMSLFLAADQVVAIHGAGLTHLVFCKPGTPVLEFFHRSYYNPCYQQLCTACQLPYTCLFDPSPQNNMGDVDITIQVDVLEAKLQQMGGY